MLLVILLWVSIACNLVMLFHIVRNDSLSTRAKMLMDRLTRECNTLGVKCQEQYHRINSEVDKNADLSERLRTCDKKIIDLQDDNDTLRGMLQDTVKEFMSADRDWTSVMVAKIQFTLGDEPQ